MKCTLHHPESRYGRPVFVSQMGRVLADDEGVDSAMRLLKMKSADIARECGVSRRTVHGWRRGRAVSVGGLNVFGLLLTRWRYQNPAKKSYDPVTDEYY